MGIRLIEKSNSIRGGEWEALQYAQSMRKQDDYRRIIHDWVAWINFVNLICQM